MIRKTLLDPNRDGKDATELERVGERRGSWRLPRRPCSAIPRRSSRSTARSISTVMKSRSWSGLLPGYLGHRETHPLLSQEVLHQHHTEKIKVSLVLKVDFSRTMIFMTSKSGCGGDEGSDHAPDRVPPISGRQSERSGKTRYPFVAYQGRDGTPEIFAGVPSTAWTKSWSSLPIRATARPLKRAIERFLVHPVSNLIATGQVRRGDRIRVTAAEDSDMLTFVRETEAPSWEAARRAA
jgi:hypothetical protein